MKAIHLQDDAPVTPVRFLALGDSYTIGEAVPQAERWPNQLAGLINPGRILDITFIATTGWTTEELWGGIQKTAVIPPYDLVSLLIGVNNQYRGLSIDTFREQFSFLLGKSIQYAGGDPQRVIVLSIPDWGVSPFAADRDSSKITSEITAFNAVIQERVKKVGSNYIDITPHSRTAAHDQTLIASDRLHPSGKMYAYWAQSALPVALIALSRQKQLRV